MPSLLAPILAPTPVQPAWITPAIPWSDSGRLVPGYEVTFVGAAVDTPGAPFGELFAQAHWRMREDAELTVAMGAQSSLAWKEALPAAAGWFSAIQGSVIYESPTRELGGGILLPVTWSLGPRLALDSQIGWTYPVNHGILSQTGLSVCTHLDGGLDASAGLLGAYQGLYGVGWATPALALRWHPARSWAITTDAMFDLPSGLLSLGLGLDLRS